MMTRTTYETLIDLYVDFLKLTDNATNESYTGDNAMTEGYLLKAEQHYRYAQDYRNRAQHLYDTIQKLLKDSSVDTAATSSKLEQEARQRMYGAKDITARPHVA